MINSILAKLTQGPAVMIDRPPPPAAPKSDHRSDRPCHSKVAGQTHCLRSLERATTTVDVAKNSAQVSKSQGPRIATSRPRPRPEGMAPDGAALETGAR